MSKFIKTGKLTWSNTGNRKLTGFCFAANYLCDHLHLSVGTPGVAFAILADSKSCIRVPVFTEKGEYLIVPDLDGRTFSYGDTNGTIKIFE